MTKQKWYALLNPRSTGMEVVSVKRGFANQSWLAPENWMNVSNAPAQVRSMLCLSLDDLTNNMIAGINTLDDIDHAISVRDGWNRMKAGGVKTLVISFCVSTGE